MKLDAYLTKQNLTAAEFGRRIGLDGISMWKIRTGKRLPTLPQAVAIQRVTEGKVTAEDFVP